VATQVAHLHSLSGFLRRAQFSEPEQEEAPQRGEALGVRRVAPALGSALARQQGEMRGECHLDQTLAFHEVVGRHEDAHHEVEAEDRLAEGSPDCCVDDLGTLAAQASPGSCRRFPGEPVEWPLRGRLD
jgi:hypothetical protein